MGKEIRFTGLMTGRQFKEALELEKGDLKIGYRGASFLEAGYVYLPFIPLFTTPGFVLGGLDKVCTGYLNNWTYFPVGRNNRVSVDIDLLSVECWTQLEGSWRRLFK